MNQTEPAYRGEDEEPPARSPEELEELRERTAETVADARREVDRAVATSHDQLLPGAESGVVGDYEDVEGTPSKDETRGAWPDWDKDSGKHRDEQPADQEAEQPTRQQTRPE